ncbi:hypothetical protein vseg_008856 [Gypsophila vaccaria]
MNPVISVLITHGRSLASLLVEAKRKSKLGRLMVENNDLHKRVNDTIDEMLKEFGTTISINVDFDAKTMNNVLQKVEETLQKFIQFDDKQGSTYGELQKKVEDLRRNKFPVGPCSTQHQTSKSSAQRGLSFCSLNEDLEFENAYENLTPEELECLLCVTTMLSSTKEFEVNKRYLINWLIGMEMVQDPLRGEQVLGKLVDEGFIDRVIENRTIHNRYTMNPSVMDNIIKRKMKLDLFHYHILGGNDVIFITRNQNVGLLNIKRSKLDAKTFESISKMKNTEVTKVLNLGNCGSPYLSGDRLIELERVINLKSTLRNLRKLRCLSLERVSRIVELPNTIFKLKYLKVLDLKSCHDLTKIPKGIHSLTSLTYLDLSMCYMLDHVPIDVCHLINLVVLKGFVINDDDTHIRYDKSCTIQYLSELRCLRKLSICTRRMDLPNQEDFEAFQNMDELISLKIVWIGRPDVSSKKIKRLNNVALPTKLKKIELEAAPTTIASQLLELISKHIGVEKVYIKGGRLWEFGPSRAIKFDRVKFVRLRYLHNLHINWSDFRKMIPNLDRLEIFDCPNLIFFPCDQNGIWECLE